MLSIRYLRAGRRNQAFFRIVLTEKSKPSKSGFKKILGWYNPHTKETSLQKEEILAWVDKGAQPSNSVAKLLIENKITHKNIKFEKDAPKKAKKTEEKVEKEAVKEPAAKESISEENVEVAEEKAEEAKVEVKEEDQPSSDEAEEKAE